MKRLTTSKVFEQAGLVNGKLQFYGPEHVKLLRTKSYYKGFLIRHYKTRDGRIYSDIISDERDIADYDPPILTVALGTSIEENLKALKNVLDLIGD